MSNSNDEDSIAQLCLTWNSPILHGVLIQLPVIDLLFAQRVCRLWRDTIRQSRSLQVALFMRPKYSEPEPVSRSEEHEAKVAQAGPVIPNPLLQLHFPAFFDDLWHNSDSSVSVLGPFRSMRWNLCGYVDPLQESENAKAGQSESQRMRNQTGRVYNTKAAAYARASASWRRMVPYYPAPKELQVLYNRRVWTSVNSKFRKRTFHVDSRVPSDPKLSPDERLQSTAEQERKQAVNRSCLNATRANPTHTPSLERKYLTFGLVYDITYNYWLMGFENELWHKFMHNGISEDIPKTLALDLVWAPWTKNPDTRSNNKRKMQIFEAYFKEIWSIKKFSQSQCMVLHLGWLGFNLPEDKSDTISHAFSTLHLRSEGASRLDAWSKWWDTESEFSTDMLPHLHSI